MTPTRWLITGGCGFIGTALIAHLARQGGHHIRVVDNLSVGTQEDLAQVTAVACVEPGDMPSEPSPDAVELVVGDILDADLALRASRGMDVIVHLAANTGVGLSVEDPRTDCVVNIIGTFNYLDAARQVRVPRFVFASSGAPAGEVTPPIHEELPPHPVSPYGASKLAGEGYCSAYAKTFGVDTVALRFGNVYGPLSGHKTSVVAKFIKRALEGQALEIFGDGTQTRDFIYIDDLVEAVCQAATVDGIGGEVFQIATSRETTVGELAEKLGQAFVRAGLRRPEIVYGSPRLGDVKRNFSDTTKARDKLLWRARTNLDMGLESTLSWFMTK